MVERVGGVAQVMLHVEQQVSFAVQHTGQRSNSNGCIVALNAIKTKDYAEISLLPCTKCPRASRSKCSGLCPSCLGDSPPQIAGTKTIPPLEKKKR